MQLLDISYVSTKSRPNSEFDEHSCHYICVSYTSFFDWSHAMPLMVNLHEE